jgi:hypothetical protein
MTSISHRSSPSLSSLPGAATYSSRPTTPGLEMTRITTPSSTYDTIAQLQSDKAFLQNLIEQSTREKAIFAATIERLSDENDHLKGDVEALKTRVQQVQLEAQQMTSERDILRSVVSQLQQRSPSNPYGAIGSNRYSPVTATGPRIEINRDESNDSSLTEKMERAYI